MPFFSLRRFLPKSFWGRSALIVLVPIFLIQVLSGYIFFGRHWETITRRFSENMAHRLVTALYVFETSSLTLPEKVAVIQQKIGLQVAYIHAMKKPFPLGYHIFQSRFERALSRMMSYPYTLLMSQNTTYVWVHLDRCVLRFSFPTKWLLSKTSLWWFLWSCASALFFALIAAFFMHRQLVPLAQLSRFAQSLERGEDFTSYFARGAREFRQIGLTLRSIYQKLVKKSKAQSDMLMGLSHDLRTPLARMKLQLAMMDRRSQEVTSLTQDIAQMEDMVTTYINFIKTGTLDTPKKVVVLALVFRVLKFLGAPHKKKITLNVPKGYRLFISEHALERCIQNLLKNALFYAKERVHCTLYEQDNAVYFVVEDDGPGVPPESLEAIFEPFVRLETARSLEEGSTGLGLSVVRRFVDNLGGHVRAFASPLGGLRVEVRFALVSSSTLAS